MIISSKNTRLSVDILDYQYPYHKVSGESFDHDANWLMVQIGYSDDTVNEIYKDPCLLTTELTCLIREIEDVVTGKESLYISDFLEPYLKISLMRVDDTIMIGIVFVYDTSDGIWKERGVAELMTLDRANEILNELKSLSKRFPCR